MAEMIPIKEAAVRWNITERRIATLCKDGKIVGAKKQGETLDDSGRYAEASGSAD